MITLTRDFTVKLTAEIVPRESLPPSEDTIRLTAADYRSREPLHNARVFKALWHKDFYGVNELGIFELGESGGTIGFRHIPSRIKKTDEHSKLDEVDYAEAAAMLFHLLPETELV